MSRKIAFIFILLLYFKVSAQNISRQDVLIDLSFLNEAVTNGHPVNYEAGKTFDLQACLAKTRSIKQDSISLVDYRFLLAEALYSIGCVHTSVKKNTLQINKPISYFPLPLVIISNKLYVVKDTIYNLAAQEITAINGVSADRIINTMLQFRASDGEGKTFAQTYFRKASASLLALYFNYPAYYKLVSGGETTNVKAAENLLTPGPLLATDLFVYRNKQNTFSYQGNIGMLRVHSFLKTDKPFFKSSMKYVVDKKLESLIIDLRGNTGGNRSAVISLTKYLVDTIFSYSILQPKLRTKKYVNTKGKFYLALATLKYNVGNIFKGNQTEAGRAFVYRYHPTKKVFKGKIFVITDGFTASASTMLTSWLKQHANAIFVGEQAGGGYNGNNGGAFPVLTLPKSKVQINFPAYRLMLDNKSDNRKGIVPDIQPAVTIQDIIQKRDVEMETIYNLINKSN